MIYTDFKGKKLSLLGFGAMRFPTNADGSIDEARTSEMIHMALRGGVNYIDTAYPYHGGMSETVLGRILKDVPRDSYYLATKYPGHQIAETYDPKAVFEEQLKKCNVEYFDFYLLHNVYEKSIGVYEDPRWGIIDYFIEQKKLGRIRHLGFSTHARLDGMESFLDKYGEHMEFCQIQMNYLDWTLQDAKGKYEMLTKRGIPVWVMEPLRGGKLANLGLLEKPVDDAFRFLMGLENVQMILSGMSTEDQVADNLRIFEERRPLDAQETEKVFEIAEGLKKSLPCTACRYCCDGCPVGLDIPTIIAAYNDFRFAANFNVTMAIEALPEGKRPSDCIGCGACTAVCPQNIDIPAAMKDFAQLLSQQPSWAQICKERAEAQKRSQDK